MYLREVIFCEYWYCSCNESIFKSKIVRSILHCSETHRLLDPVIQLSEGDDVVGESLSKLPPGLGPCLLPDLGGELQLDRVNVPAVPGAVHLSDPAASVVLVSPRGRLSEVEIVLVGRV